MESHPFDQLVDDILSVILHQLCIQERFKLNVVCKRWMNLINKLPADEQIELNLNKGSFYQITVKPNSNRNTSDFRNLSIYQDGTLIEESPLVSFCGNGLVQVIDGWTAKTLFEFLPSQSHSATLAIESTPNVVPILLSKVRLFMYSSDKQRSISGFTVWDLTQKKCIAQGYIKDLSYMKPLDFTKVNGHPTKAIALLSDGTILLVDIRARGDGNDYLDNEIRSRAEKAFDTPRIITKLYKLESKELEEYHVVTCDNDQLLMIYKHTYRYPFFKTLNVLQLNRDFSITRLLPEIDQNLSSGNSGIIMNGGTPILYLISENELEIKGYNLSNQKLIFSITPTVRNLKKVMITKGENESLKVFAGGDKRIHYWNISIKGDVPVRKTREDLFIPVTDSHSSAFRFEYLIEFNNSYLFGAFKIDKHCYFVVIDTNRLRTISFGQLTELGSGSVTRTAFAVGFGFWGGLTLCDFTRSVYPINSLVIVKGQSEQDRDWPALVIDEFPLTGENLVKLLGHDSIWRVPISRIYGYQSNPNNNKQYWYHKELIEVYNLANEIFYNQMKVPVNKMHNNNTTSLFFRPTSSYQIDVIQQVASDPRTLKSIHIFNSYPPMLQLEKAGEIDYGYFESDDYDDYSIALSDRMPAYLNTEKAGHYIVFDSSRYISYHESQAVDDFYIYLIQYISGKTFYHPSKDRWPFSYPSVYKLIENSTAINLKSITLYNVKVSSTLKYLDNSNFPNLETLCLWERLYDNHTNDTYYSTNDSNFKNLRKLDIRNIDCKGALYNLINWILSSCYQLKHICLDNHNIDKTKDIFDSLSSMTTLETINIYPAPIYGRMANEDARYDALKQVIVNNPNISSIRIKMRHSLISECINNITNSGISTNLKKLIISNLEKVVEPEPSVVRILITKPLAQLEEIEVNYLHLDDEFVSNLVQQAPNIHHLRLTGQNTITEAGVISMGNLKQLKSLEISNSCLCGNLDTDLQVMETLSKIPLLETLTLVPPAISTYDHLELSITSLSSRFIDICATGFKSLKHLTFHSINKDKRDYKTRKEIPKKENQEITIDYQMEMLNSNNMIRGLAELPNLETLKLMISHDIINNMGKSLQALSMFAVQCESGKCNKLGRSLRTLKLSQIPYTDSKNVRVWRLDKINPNHKLTVEVDVSKYELSMKI